MSTKNQTPSPSRDATSQFSIEQPSLVSYVIEYKNEYLMDLKKMHNYSLLMLLGVLMLVPGSTLNAIKSTATTATPTAAVANNPMSTVSATEVSAAAQSFSIENRENITNILRWSKTNQEFFSKATPPPLNLHKAGTASWAHSISPNIGGGLEAGVKAKSSITASTKDGRLKYGAVTHSSERNVVREAEVNIAIADYNYATEISSTQITKILEKASQSELKEAKVITVTATEGQAFNGSSTQSTTKVDMTTKRTKVSLSRLVTVDKENNQRAPGENGESSENDGSRLVAKSTTAVTPVPVVTTRTSPISKIEANVASTISRPRTIQSLSAAATAQLVATSFPITTISNEDSLQKYQHTSGSIRLYSQLDTHNNKHNYNYDYNNDLIQARGGKDNNNTYVNGNNKHISSQNTQHWRIRQQKTPPLQRPKIQKGDVDTHIDTDSDSDSDSVGNDNSNNFFYNSNNNYFSSHKSAPSSILIMQQQQPLRQLRQQYARQVQQPSPISAMLTTPATSSTTSAVRVANYSDLISYAIHSKQTTANVNKSTPMKSRKNAQQLNLPSIPSAISVSLTSTTKYGTASVALDEQVAMNGTTVTSPFPTVTTNIVKSTTRRPPPTTTPRPTPSIDDYQTVISQAGTHAYLPCNVKQLVKKPISWLRVRDGHILTVDQTTFIADQRFQSIFAQNPERWSLQIKYVQVKDEGTYECQVSTEPKASAIVTLRVVEPRTELIGEPTRHVKAGSQVKLRCIISQALEPPLFINWFHNQKQIYLHSRRGWRTEIERIELPLTEAPTTTSTSTTITPSTTTTSTPTIITSPTPNTQVEGATTISAPADTVTPTASPSAISAPKTTTLQSETDGIDSYSDIVYAGTDPVAVEATGEPTLLGGVIALATTMSLVSIPPSAISTDSDSEASALGVGNSFAFGTGNTTLSLLAATTAAAVTMSTALPTVTKAMNWPRTTTTITTASTTLAAVEVRQITTASLIIPSVEKQDSGNYTCSPSNSAPKTVVLHVLNGEYSASAITSGVNENCIIGNDCKWHLTLLLLLLQHWHHKFTGIHTILRIIALVLWSHIWPYTKRSTYTKTAKTTPTRNLFEMRSLASLKQLENIAWDYREICSSCREQVRSIACQQPTFLGVYSNKYTKGYLPIGNIARQAGSKGNCDDRVLDFDWRAGSMQRVLAKMGKT